MKLKNILLPLVQKFTGLRYDPALHEVDKKHHFDKNVWVANIFRGWEYIAGRKFGIRKESATQYIPRTNEYIIELYTWEAIFAYIEISIREFLKHRLFPVRLHIISLAMAKNTSTLQVPWISFAIALDTSVSSGEKTASPFTWSHTCTGSNGLIAITFGRADNTNLASQSASYNSVSATQAVITTGKQGASNIYASAGIFLLAGPSTGSNTVSVSNTASAPDYGGVSISYTGVSQTSAADATGSNHGTAIGAQTFTVTTVANNCWIVMCATQINGSAPTATQTSRGSVTFSVNWAGGFRGSDTNGAVSAGSNTVGFTINTGGTDWAMVGASIAPAAVAPTVTDSAATNITAVQAQGNGNVTSDGGSSITQRGFCWATTANPTTVNSKVVVGGTTGAYNGNMTGLSPNVTYHYRAYAINAVGTSYGADQQFTTLISADLFIGSYPDINFPIKQQNYLYPNFWLDPYPRPFTTDVFEEFSVENTSFARVNQVEGY